MLLACLLQSQQEGRRAESSQSLQEGLRLRTSLGPRHAHTLGETHLAVVLELHPASVAKFLQGKKEAQLDRKTKSDRTAIKGQGILSSILSSFTFPFLIYIHISLNIYI